MKYEKSRPIPINLRRNLNIKDYRNTKYRKQIPPLPLPPESVMEFSSVDIMMMMKILKVLATMSILKTTKRERTLSLNCNTKNTKIS